VGAKLLDTDGTVPHARRRERQAPAAACLLVRREAFAAVGGFDEDRHDGFADVDLCLRLGERGGRIVHQPRSVLRHLERRSAARPDHEAAGAQRLAGDG
jgi:GT2 family glycosyltransferase